MVENNNDINPEIMDSIDHIARYFDAKRTFCVLLDLQSLISMIQFKTSNMNGIVDTSIQSLAPSTIIRLEYEAFGCNK